ncbi:hypothetical protein DPEC_G00222530 [Dallia pectoralis]|uniref:Uncharacterized protein n=1 Tax=Dallia pectoralis TaxID=75939 RepID=A0ACC2FZK8_DALPE|nr:hypothetical protein DPEC_G00222530 [Dallia pectoralis]
MELVIRTIKMTKSGSRVIVPVLLLCCIFYYYLLVFAQRNGGVLHKGLCDSFNVSQMWESLNFNVSRNTKLFLNLEDFFWQLNLSTLALPYGVKGSEHFLVKVLAAVASYEMPGKIKNLPCRTCVVVGNGFRIKNSSLGGSINKYDIVIRLNDGPVRGYEEDVGNRTTMRFFYPESAFYDTDMHNDPDTLLVLVPFKQQDVRWLKEILYNEKRTRKGFWKPPPQIWKGRTSNLRILDPYYMHQTARRLLNLPINTPAKRKRISMKPTTGILAIVVALNVCNVVHIAGFGYPDTKNMTHPVHYYGRDMMKAMQSSSHNISTETKALKKLKDSGAIVNLHLL